MPAKAKLRCRCGVREMMCRLDDECESGVTRLGPSRTLKPAPSFRAPWYPDDVDAVAAAH